MKEFCIHANGFIGSALETNGQMVSSKTIPTTPGSSISVSQSSSHFYNRKIVDNYVTLLRSPSHSITFDYREKVLKDVIEAFGMPYLDAWFAANYATGFIDPLRARFLDETVSFVCGKGRGMPLNVYLSSIGLPGDKIPLSSFSEPLEELLGVSSVENGLTQNTLKTSEFIQSWISQPGGFNDLLTSAMILWGDHSIR